MLFNPENIPIGMRSLNQWVCWKYATVKGRKTKIPYQVNGRKADSTNPETWGSFESVLGALENGKGKYSGIGFVLSENTEIVGIDWDHVRNPDTGEWEKEALDEIRSLNSYAELSPSGTGAHVLIKGKIPGNRRRKGNLEMYQKGRYFTVTGEHIKRTPGEITSNQEAIDSLYKKRFGEDETEPRQEKEIGGEEEDDIIKEIIRTEEGRLLFFGKWDSSKYSSQSEADEALCCMIAGKTQDKEKFDRIFRKSGLYREKWETETYRRLTIENALKYMQENKYKNENKNENNCKGSIRSGIRVSFDFVGERIMEKFHIFTMRDTKQIYIYEEGVYKAEGAEAKLDTEIREEFKVLFTEEWRKIFPGSQPDEIPAVRMVYVSEVLSYIRAYTHKSREEIDTQQEKYINLKNGLFNLATWELEEHRPEYISIRQIPVNYIPDKKCPKIDKFLKEIVEPEDVPLLLEWVGYCLTPDCSFQKAFMIYGGGGNGKSVFLALLQALIGYSNTSAESLQQLETDRFSVAKLYGKLVNVCADIPNTRMHKSDIFKKITGGDTLRGEQKYKDPFEFKNTAKMIFSANEIPEGGEDYSFYRRWMLVKFPNTFREGKRNNYLIKTLTEEGELSGLLNLALEGLKRLRENDAFSYSKTVEDTEKEYIMNSNHVALFASEIIQVSEDDCSATDMYLAYLKWTKFKGIKPYANNEFSKRLKELHYTNRRDNEPIAGTSCKYKKVPLWENVSVNKNFLDKLQPQYNLKPVQNFTEDNDCVFVESGQAGQGSTPNVVFKRERNTSSSCEYEEVNGKGIGESTEKVKHMKNSLSSLSKSEKNDNKESDESLDRLNPKKETSLSKPVQSHFEFENKENCNAKNIPYCELLLRDLNNFAKTYYHCIVDDINGFVEEFNRKYPGYLKDLGLDIILFYAKKLSERGWK